MTDGRPWAPVPLARGAHGAVVAPHHLATAAGPRRPARGRRRGGRGDRHERRPRRGHAQRLRHRRRRVLADLGRRRPAGRSRSTARAGRRPRPMPARAARAGLATLPRRGPLTITVPGAVRSWGDAHARFGRLSRGDGAGPGHRAGTGRVPGLGRLRRRRRGDGAAVVAAASGRRAGFFAVYRPHGRAVASRASGSASRPSRRRSSGIADDGFDAFYDGDLGERQARGLAAAGSPITRGRPARPHLDLERADRHRLPRRPRHDPPAEQLRASSRSSCWRSCRGFEPPPAAAFGPDGVTDPAWIHARASRRRSWPWPTATRT